MNRTIAKGALARVVNAWEHLLTPNIIIIIIIIGHHYNPVFLPDYNDNIKIRYFYRILMLILKSGTDKLLEL